MKIGFQWLEGVFAETIEMFDESDFIDNCISKQIEHDVIFDAGVPPARAICLLSVNGNRATLDYEAFFEENKSRDMYWGITILSLERTPQLRIVGASWRNHNDTKYSEWKIEPINRTSPPKSLSEASDIERSKVAAALRLSTEKRREILETSRKFPRKMEVTSYIFDRNPLVIAEALNRANGRCERCKDSPFISKSTQRPYLEVHHTVPLSEHGEDAVTNVEALCPNCHRKAHFG